MESMSTTSYLHSSLITIFRVAFIMAAGFVMVYFKVFFLFTMKDNKS